MTYIKKTTNTPAIGLFSTSNSSSLEVDTARQRLQETQSQLQHQLNTVVLALEEQKECFARFRSEMENLKDKIARLDKSARSCQSVTNQWQVKNLVSKSRKLKSIG